MSCCDDSCNPEACQIHFHVAFIWFVRLDERYDSENVTLVYESDKEKECQGNDEPYGWPSLGLSLI